MVGQMRLVREKGRGRMEAVELGPVPVLRATVYEPEGLSGKRLERRLKRAERRLAKAGVCRIVLGADFPYGEKLRVLRPIDVWPMRRGLADVFALGALAAQGIPPNRGRVALSAPRLCPELTAAAERLCPQVRGLLIDAPGGVEYARWLHVRCGIPVTPPAAGADVTAAFGPGGGRWGRTVELYDGGSLHGLTLRAEDLTLPEDCAGQLLALLWEEGRLNRKHLTAVLEDAV